MSFKTGHPVYRVSWIWMSKLWNV